MYTRAQARNFAKAMEAIHGEPWVVFRTPSSAVCNQSPMNLFNAGHYAACPASEQEDYERGGAEFDA